MSRLETNLDIADRTSLKAPARSRFFVGMSVVLLLIVATGFAPTLYLRAYFDVWDIPNYLVVHGSVLTVWFVWFFIQTALVAAGRIDLHRPFGVAGILIGAGVILAAVMATFGFIPRMVALGRDMDGNIARYAGVVWANLGMAITFTALFTLAIKNRRRPDFHKRLMLLASISIVGPALGRLGRYPWLQFSESHMINEGAWGLGGLIVLLLFLAVYDRRTSGRLHTVTRWGAPLVFASPFVFGLIVANTPFGRGIVPMLT